MPGSNAARRTILVTGFGGFPGAARNPTERIVAELRRHAPRLARLGVELRCAVLPVEYAGLQVRLDRLAEAHRPDVVLHFGLAGRRRRVSVELRAVNRAGPLHPDAAGRRPGQVLVPGGAPVLRATIPARRVLAALRAAGAAAHASHDAGDYLCNAVLYRSLAKGAVTGAVAGFIHVPRPVAVPDARRPTRGGTGRPSRDALAAAALAAVLHLARQPLARQPSARRAAAG